MMRSPARSRRAMIVALAAWFAAAACAATLILKALRAHGYVFDMAANFAAHTAWVAVVLAVGAAVLRRWTPAAVLAAVAIVHAVWLMPGRAPRATASDGPGVTVVQFNALAVNRTPERVMELLESSEADLIGIVEAPDALIEMIRGSESLRARYPHQSWPSLADERNNVRLSKHPFVVLDLVDRTNPADLRRYILGHTAVVDHPSGRFVHALMVPASPRTPALWAAGNADLESELMVLAERIPDRDLPWVVGIDMNGTPGSHRADIAREAAGLVRAEPWRIGGGTWPSWAPPIFRFSIDDVLVSRGIRVRSWGVLEESAGSDHLPIMADLILDRPRTP